MGQAAVRAAVAAAIEGAQLPYVGSVHPTRHYIGEEDYEVNAAGYYTESVHGSGCVIVVNLPGPTKRMRRTLTGRGHVDDTQIHQVVLELFFASTDGHPPSAQDDYDTVADALIVFIRNNPTMISSDVWSAGEYTAGVTITSSSPFTRDDGTTVFIYGVVRYEAWEWIAGTDV